MKAREMRMYIVGVGVRQCKCDSGSGFLCDCS
jgi:hypothetical protein